MAPSDPRQTKFVLDESRIPRAWYNIAADLPVPPLAAPAPGHAQPIGPADLAPLFPMALIARRSRPSARSRSRSRSATRTGSTGRARSTAPTGSSARSIRRPTSTTSTRAAARPAATSRTPRSPQAFYNKEEGVKRLATETGAGQWGSALAFAGACFGLEVKVYMVRASYDQKPYRRILMETYGAEVVASPSLTTNYGRNGPRRDARQPGLARDGDQRGRRGRRDPRRHQVRPGLGAQPRPAPPDGHRPGGDRADGDGRRVARRHHRLRRRRLELRGPDLPVPRPQLPRGREAPDHRRRARGRAEPDPRRLRLRLRRHRARWRRSSRCTRSAHDFIPEPIHAGGLRYHGMSPLVSLLKEHGVIEARSVHQRASFEAGVAVRPGGGHPAGARADPRHPGRDRRGARGARKPARPG